MRRQHAHKPSRFEWYGKKWDWYLAYSLIAILAVLVLVVAWAPIGPLPQ